MIDRARKLWDVVRSLRARLANKAFTNGRVARPVVPAPYAPPAGFSVPERVPNPDLTVVIPVYNSEAWLDDCLSSVLAQGGVTLEVVCINDGSTDGSRAVLQRFADADPRVTILDQANQGQSVGRNAGLDAAAGSYLIYLDSDDFWPEDTLASLVSKADAESLDLLLFDCFAFLDGEISEATWKRYSTYYQRKTDYADVRSGAEMIADMRRNRDYRPHVGMYLARTQFVRDIGARFIPGIIHQDNPYTFALMLNAERVAHMKTDVYARRMRPGSTITTLRDARSVKGYYLSYIAMTREVQGRVYSKPVSDMIAEVVDGVFSGAEKKVAALSNAELAEIQALDPQLDAQVIFQRLKAARSR